MIWDRAIILVDMNAFFASIEQLDRPEWRGRPVAITNGAVGTCIITCSYEARAYGLKTGMRLIEARTLCPDLIQCAARPERYAQVSTNIMQALQDITPDIEVFSVDEAFLDVTHCQKLHGSPERIAQMTKDIVYEASGILCSVGVSGDKTTAKYAAKLNKPNGLTVVPPWQSEQTLHNVAVTELCGIAKGIGNFLGARGVYTCGDMKHLPIGVLGQRFGNPGKRIWYMAQGKDPDKVIINVPPPKSIGHGKVMPPNTKDKHTLLVYLLHMSEKVGARLRRHQMTAQKFYIGLLADEWIALKLRSTYPTDDGQVLYQLAQKLLRYEWAGEGIRQVQITALDPKSSQQQMELFGVDSPVDHSQKNKVMDAINNRYGEFSLAPGRLLDRSSMPNVIAPAWKPFGHRQTI